MSLGIDIEALRAVGFRGAVITRGDPGYDEANARWSKLIERKAGLVVHPLDSKDVAIAIKLAVSKGVAVVIKGGGHGGSPSSSSDGGLVVDLSVHLNTLHVDPVKQTITVGGGTRWSAIDLEVQKHGLAIVGPTHNDVGVGGFVLGGGYGGLTGRMGLACDNLLSGTLVTANGEIVDVTEESEPELLWGLRGAGCNFGPLTSLTLQLVPEPEKIFGGNLIFPPPRFSDVWETVNTYRQNTMVPEDSVSIVLAQGPKGPAIILSFAHHGPGVEAARRRFSPFFDLGPIMDTTGLTTNAEVNDRISKLNPPGYYVYTLSAAHDKTPVETADGVFKEMLALWSRPHFAKSQMIISFTETTKLRDPDASAKSCFGGRGTWGNVLEVITWEQRDHSAERADEAAVAARKLRDLWAMDSHIVTYGNPESDQGVKDERTRILFGSNYKRLQALKRKWDPSQVWNTWFPITPSVD